MGNDEARLEAAWEKEFDHLCQILFDISDDCRCEFCTNHTAQIGVSEMKKLKDAFRKTAYPEFDQAKHVTSLEDINNHQDDALVLMQVRDIRRVEAQAREEGRLEMAKQVLHLIDALQKQAHPSTPGEAVPTLGDVLSEKY